MKPAQQRLLEITAAHIRLLTELDQVLQGETGALGSRNLNDLQAATDRKNDLLGQLEGMGKEFTRLCEEAGVQPNRDGLLGAEVTSVMADAWSRMCRLLERCEERNRINGVTINASRNFAENLLALLQGGQGRAKTYGRTGNVFRDGQAKALGSV
ncbi:MAG: flagellar protein FlgN [Gammaproteobacteria bacterium]|nr:flagellar protein FlgN [Gammaproteobacteria bacterium]MCG3143531.1 hypothetical protein [Gammaproteobacteria bacterium]